mmetsp:Transcript_119775/g.219339  ORF Transcript_119775/g.219339 Transcript_119775/m.219339 type:complete len:210 (+) Transcript_119775:404-1033(+)
MCRQGMLHAGYLKSTICTDRGKRIIVKALRSRGLSSVGKHYIELALGYSTDSLAQDWHSWELPNISIKNNNNCTCKIKGAGFSRCYRLQHIAADLLAQVGYVAISAIKWAETSIDLWPHRVFQNVPMRSVVRLWDNLCMLHHSRFATIVRQSAEGLCEDIGRAIIGIPCIEKDLYSILPMAPWLHFHVVDVTLQAFYCLVDATCTIPHH